MAALAVAGPTSDCEEGNKVKATFPNLMQLLSGAHYEQVLKLLYYREGMNVLSLADRMTSVLPEECVTEWLTNIALLRFLELWRPKDSTQESTWLCLHSMVKALTARYRNVHNAEIPNRCRISEILFDLVPSEKQKE